MSRARLKSVAARWVSKDPMKTSDWADVQTDLSIQLVHVILLILSCAG